MEQHKDLLALEDSLTDNEGGLPESSLNGDSSIDRDGALNEIIFQREHIRTIAETNRCLQCNSFSVSNETSQMAIIGSKFSHIESLDYEIVENDILKQDWRAQTGIQMLDHIVLKWTLACFVGILTGVTSIAVNMAVQNLEGTKLASTSYFMDNQRIVLAFAIFGGSNLVLVLFSAALCGYFAPAAAGSGIPEVKAYLNGIDAPNILASNTLIVKVLGSIGAVAGGLDVGKEGPLVHIGACIASLLSQGGLKCRRLTRRWLYYFQNDRDHRDLVTCGAAAGVAAAFRAPVGGVLFALEEAPSWWQSSLLWMSFFTTAVVAVVLRIVPNQSKCGNCGIFGSGGLIMFDIRDVSVEFELIQLFPVVILGTVGGFLGSLFTFLNGKIVRTYSHWQSKHGPIAKLLQAAIISVVSSVCMFGLPWLVPCTPCPQNLAGWDGHCSTTDKSGNLKQFACPSEEYNGLATLFFNTNDDVIRSLLNANTPNVFSFISLLLFLVSSYLLALVTYGTAIPSGLFIPVIISGATYGRLAGMIMRSLNGLQKLDEGLYAFLGAASLLGGSMRMTVSLCVILLELTDNLLMLPLTMLSLLISKTIGDLFNQSVYDQIVLIKGLPFLKEHPEPYMKHLTALDVCTGSLVTLSGLERVGRIVEALEATNHNGFPVIDDNPLYNKPIFFGLILRSHLLVLLKQREFLSSNTVTFTDQGKPLSFVDLAKPQSGKGMRSIDVELTQQEREMFIDLHPFTNTSPYTVVDAMPLAKAFTLFRRLSLRHLCVVPKTPGKRPIVGILTRHDFMPEHILNLYPHLKQSTWKRLR